VLHVEVFGDPGLGAVAFGRLGIEPEVNAGLAAAAIVVSLHVDGDGRPGLAAAAVTEPLGVELGEDAGVDARLPAAAVGVGLDVGVDRRSAFDSTDAFGLDETGGVDPRLTTTAVAIGLDVGVERQPLLDARASAGDIHAAVDAGLPAAAGAVGIEVGVDGRAELRVRVGEVHAGVDTSLHIACVRRIDVDVGGDAAVGATPLIRRRDAGLGLHSPAGVTLALDGDLRRRLVRRRRVAGAVLRGTTCHLATVRMATKARPKGRNVVVTG
jgi:hypothetical protein